jgi:hypothetical protein
LRPPGARLRLKPSRPHASACSLDFVPGTLAERAGIDGVPSLMPDSDICALDAVVLVE